MLVVRNHLDAAICQPLAREAQNITSFEQNIRAQLEQCLSKKTRKVESLSYNEVILQTKL